MGLDAYIEFRFVGEGEVELDCPLPPGFAVARKNVAYDDDIDTTHEVDCDCTRYYGFGYERGQWPRICAALMILLSTEAVECVRYGNSCAYLPKCDMEKVLALSKHYMEHGRRPFFPKRKRKLKETNDA